MLPNDERLPPPTRESLAHDLRMLGLASGMLVLLHSSLSSLGWVCGGASAARCTNAVRYISGAYTDRREF